MFMLSMGPGMTTGMPDVCLTPSPVGPVPVPYPNIGMSSMAAGSAMTVLTGGTPTVNQMANISMTSGDEGGLATGLVSHMVKGQNSWILGSTGTFIAGTPAMRLTSVGGGNAMGVTPNCPSTCVAPSQPTVMVLR